MAIDRAEPSVGRIRAPASHRWSSLGVKTICSLSLPMTASCHPELLSAYVTEQGHSSPDLQSGDEWPPPLPVAHLPGRIATYGSAERAQDFQVQTPAHCRAGRNVGVYLAPGSGTLQSRPGEAPGIHAPESRQHHHR